MREALFTMVPLLVTVAHALIDDATLAKVRANAITSAQRRYAFSPFSAYLSITYH